MSLKSKIFRPSWPGWLILGTAGFVILLDQLTKRWIEANLALYESIFPVPALAQYFSITHFYNTGAAFGLFRNQTVLFVIIPVVIIVAIVVYSRYLPLDRKVIALALGLQLGGALGNNLFDRVRLGHVTDFLYFHELPLIGSPWPAFNIADMAIVGGVILLALIILLEREPSPEAAEVVEPASTNAEG